MNSVLHGPPCSEATTGTRPVHERVDTIFNSEVLSQHTGPGNTILFSGFSLGRELQGRRTARRRAANCQQVMGRPPLAVH